MDIRAKMRAVVGVQALVEAAMMSGVPFARAMAPGLALARHLMAVRTQ